MTQETEDLLTDAQLARILLDLLDHPGPVSRQRDRATGDVRVAFSTGLSYTLRPDGETCARQEPTRGR